MKEIIHDVEFVLNFDREINIPEQIDVCRELLGIGRVQAWELARRSPGEWSRRVGKATRRHGVRPT